MKRVALAYSGGLDTSVCVGWLKDRGYAVVTFAANLGQGMDADALNERALTSGAEKAFCTDLREAFANEYVTRALKANAVYEDGYLLSTALGRPLIAEALVKVAQENDCGFVAHGCTGKGNDQVRFEASFAALDPSLGIIAPAREWKFRSREEEIDYAVEHGIVIEATRKSPYSLDSNLWGCAIECGVLEDPWTEPPDDAWQLTTNPEKAPDAPAYVEIDFERGVPVAVDGERMDLVDLIIRLNALAGRHGVGRTDLVENRLVGIKSREVYEAPAATVLVAAHRAVESLVLDRELAALKEQLGRRYGRLIYDGVWFAEIRRALDAFFDASQAHATGRARIKLFKGAATVVGRTSEHSLYAEDLATYGEKDAFNHASAKGFIEIWSLPLRQEGRRRD